MIRVGLRNGHSGGVCMKTLTKMSLSLAVTSLFLGLPLTHASADQGTTNTSSDSTTLSKASEAAGISTDSNDVTINNDNNSQPAVISSADTTPFSTFMVIGGSGLTWHLQSTKKFNNLTVSQFLTQLGGEFLHYGKDYLGDPLVKQGVHGHAWYTASRYTAQNAGHVYLKVVTKAYSNSSRTHLTATVEEQWKA